MKQYPGFEYVIQGTTNTDEFAKGVLNLLNIMSTRKNTILEIKTIDRTHRVMVKTIVDLDGLFKANDEIWTVIDKEDIVILDEVEYAQPVYEKAESLYHHDKGVFIKGDQQY
ncbi:hypothetical protein [Geomicrobium sp. JCM 19055]|uniref:hypothetical protein n=1 Tax=Geomicrobium sp. JCM 19055 TaxID=1460649 RepID=UPI0005A98A57|nr:hypothetical protein [Geomicrobium sp. JCM 19055]